MTNVVKIAVLIFNLIFSFVNIINGKRISKFNNKVSLLNIPKIKVKIKVEDFLLVLLKKTKEKNNMYEKFYRCNKYWN